MLKRNQKAILNNRGTHEIGSVTKSYRRKDVHYYDILTERGITFEGITEDRSFPVFVDHSLSIKLNNKKLKPLHETV